VSAVASLKEHPHGKVMAGLKRAKQNGVVLGRPRSCIWIPGNKKNEAEGLSFRQMPRG